MRRPRFTGNFDMNGFPMRRDQTDVQNILLLGKRFNNFGVLYFRPDFFDPPGQCIIIEYQAEAL